MEGAVKAGDGGQFGQRIADRLQGAQPARLMQRGQLRQAMQCAAHPAIDAHGLVEAFATVHDAVPHGLRSGQVAKQCRA